MSLKVSILMNGYNCEKFVVEAISSVVRQTYSNWEIVFVDNCSTDNTKPLIMAFDDVRIKYVNTPINIPLGEARSFGLEFCDGDFVCFLDTDDLWVASKLAEQLKLFHSFPDLKMVYTGGEFIDESGDVIGEFIPKAIGDDVFEQQLVRYEVNQQSVMIRNNFSFEIDKSKKYSVDFSLFMPICAFHKVRAIKAKMIKYRLHSSNFSHNAGELEWLEQKDTLDAIFDNRPSLKSDYKKGYRHAYARVSYYKARYLFSIGENFSARKILFKHAFVGVFYFSLLILSFFPASVWLRLHKKVRRFS